ncbi:MAG: alpha-galactosidase [Lachnospiraceae bacterium]|nr:alpha-galactosidase [Lachnospiraceae bacterium]
MIFVKDSNFFLNTENTTYAFGVNSEGMLEHLHYGGPVPVKDKEDRIADSFRAMHEKVSHGKGTTINYSKDSLTVTEDILLEVSSLGKGDLREPSVILEYADGSRTSDFIYESHEVMAEPFISKTLPNAISEKEGDCEQLKITLTEREKKVKLDIYYTVFPACDVITKKAVLRNETGDPVKILKLMSAQLDIDESGMKYTTFGGNWGREMHRCDTYVNQGIHVNNTVSGVSSNRANPFVMLTKPETTETSGEGYGFNLIYSGNHYESAGVSGFYKTRFMTGIDPTDFEWILLAGESFETPEAVMTYTDMGYRGISLNMQHFVRRHIVRGKFKNKPRPILLNSWEAAYFNISEAKLMGLAKKAAEAGIELFVMDDGWFGVRNDDRTSLGDWYVNKKKLPGGVESLASKVHALGLQFGIWVEPEMISEESNLYKAHPEYAMHVPGRENSPGRNQMILDLTNPEVVSYVKESMRAVFGTKGVDYVKWDMNRMFADVYSGVSEAGRQRETAHRYVLGLYDIMRTLTEEFPDVLFEGCASGGNRFDLGILAYMPQIWASDDSDAMERTVIQTGYSYGYPMSTVTAHVSACPNHQTLRNTPLDTRFNVASFGVLGYELNLCELSGEDFKAVKQQVATYKEWRDVFFYGDFYRVGENQWMVVSPDRKNAVTLVWNRMCNPNDFYMKLRTVGLDPETDYHVYNIQLKHNIKEFGDLVNQVAPIHIKKDSLIHNTIARFYKMDGEVEDYVVSGALLNNAGIKLTQAFGGTGYNGETRLFQDYASRLYFISAVE